ncbi:sensor histidine kinase [Derxia gummosa]|uniref:histidine kinase n=1 Tax=Derxia gummosa DSM 723 TaxID=1121388 RepID=A0A8B6X8Y5_9BURK|nr:DUF4118 domain-containing protein [Derxia gummosa]
MNVVDAEGVVQAVLARVARVRGSAWRSYGLSLLLFGSALGIRFACDNALPNGFPFLTFFPAIVLSAFLCGWRPALACAFLSTLSAWYWFIEPRQTFTVNAQSGVALGFFIVVGLVDIIVIELMTDALGRLRRAQARTDELLDQRTVLFHELQHRVANSLMHVSTLLARQRKRLAHNDEAAAALADARLRFDAMSRMHRRLYDPQVFDQPLASVLEALCADFLLAQGRIGLRCEVVAVDVRFGLDRLTTLALLLLELITNAVKHGFGAEGTGLIEVHVTCGGDGSVVLCVEDDGRGVPAGFDPDASEGLGMRIAAGLARALQGELEYRPRTAGGTAVSLRIPLTAEDRLPASEGGTVPALAG